MTIGYGIDLSHFQDPALLPWASWAGKVDFVIARACYGTERDRCTAEHVRRARDIGAKVGLYAFFRNIDTVNDQLSTLHAMADLCRIDDGDIVPAVDIERDPFPAPGRAVSPDWSAAAQLFVEAIGETWSNALVYMTQREWHQLGAPSWVLRRPLWVAHYTSAATPATPGNLPACVWQHRVGDFNTSGPGGLFVNEAPQIDQNRLLAPLPLVGQVVTDFERDRIEGLIAMSLSETVHPEWPAPPKDVA